MTAQLFRVEATIHVVVDRDRRLTPPAGVRLTRRAGFADHVLWNLGPPRLRLEEAALDLALAARTDLDAVAALADACGSRRTTAWRLRSELDARPWVPRRAWLAEVLADLGAGSCSVLEREYLTRVERPHGLPTGLRQAAAHHAGRTTWQDVRYDEWGLVVELDGRLHHSSARQRDRDLDRDLAVAVTDGLTLRLGWGQVLDRPCATAASVGAVLSSRGWPGPLMPCGKCGAPDQPG